MSSSPSAPINAVPPLIDTAQPKQSLNATSEATSFCSSTQARAVEPEDVRRALQVDARADQGDVTGYGDGKSENVALGSVGSHQLLLQEPLLAVLVETEHVHGAGVASVVVRSVLR